MSKRKTVIGVMGGAAVSAEVEAQAERLGRLIAQQGWILLTGGRNAGVMAAASRGASQAGGLVVGVLPDRDASGASPDVDIAIVTGMGDARNVVNVLSSNVVIALPGGAGTLSELAFALKNRKPVVALGFDAGPAVRVYRTSGLLVDASTPEEAVAVAKRLIDS